MYGNNFQPLRHDGFVRHEDWNRLAATTDALAHVGQQQSLFRSSTGVWFAQPEYPWFWAQVTSKLLPVDVPSSLYGTTRIPVLGFQEQLWNRDGTCTIKEDGLRSDLTQNPYVFPMWEINGNNVPVGAYVQTWLGPGEDVYYCHYEAETWVKALSYKSAGSYGYYGSVMCWRPGSGMVEAYPPSNIPASFGAGSVTITPASMAYIVPGNTVFLQDASGGNANELVTVLTTTPTSFTTIATVPHYIPTNVYPLPVWLNFPNGYVLDSTDIATPSFFKCRREDNDPTSRKLPIYTSDFMDGLTGVFTIMTGASFDPTSCELTTFSQNWTFRHGLLVKAA